MTRQSENDVLNYTPIQPGYIFAGRPYNEISFSSDCSMGKYICQIFELQNTESGPIRVIPDGCNDIVITFDGQLVSGKLSPSVHGALDFDFGRTKWIFGVRFLPGATLALLPDALEYSPQSSVDLQELFPSFSDIEADLAVSGSFARRCELMLDFIQSRIRGDEIYTAVYSCAKRIIQSGGAVSAGQLSQQSGYSDRYIRGLFSRHAGHSPKELAAIVRMQSALKELYLHPNPNLGQLAAQFGFRDQSHMNREFRKFLGITSGAIKGDESWILKLKSEGVRFFR